MTQNFVTRFSDYKPSGRTVNGLRVAVGVDIDGCVDPGMYKHEPGFAIATLYHFKLQMITPIAMRAWMFENCYSLDRGVSRFVALCNWADILRETPAVRAAGVKIPELKYLRRWGEITKSLSPEALSGYIDAGDLSGVLEQGDSEEGARAELLDVLEWSAEVNRRAVQASENLSSFPNVEKALRKMNEVGVDICAVSGTPEDHVISHLEEYGLLDCFRAVFAQQAGKKNLALTAMMAGYREDMGAKPLLADSEPRYDVIAMFGDAPQDFKEAKKANVNLTGREDSPVRMYLIQVGRENESWNHFYENVLDKLVNDDWSREEELALVDEGLANLDRVWEPDVMPIDTFAKRGEKS